MDRLERAGKLPTAFHGYARQPVDRLLEEVEESHRGLIAERDELRASLDGANERLSTLTSELDRHVGQERAVADALIEAEQKAKELTKTAESDAEGMRAAAELKADAILRDAQTRADRLVEETKQALEERTFQAENLLDDARARLGSLVRDLLDQIGTAARDHDSTVVDQGTGETPTAT